MSIDTSSDNSGQRLVARDNGRGMSWREARQFLLNLYSSSKDRAKSAAGCFGVGFWSILLFEPDEILIRSQPEREREGWSLTLDRSFDFELDGWGGSAPGTEVHLRRADDSCDLYAAVWHAVRRDAAYLRSLGVWGTALEVRVNGCLANESMRPEAPGVGFSGRGMRGFVSLGDEAKVDLLAYGLRVRSVAVVDDLLLDPGRKPARSRQVSGPGLRARVVVDSDRLAVLMARGDVAQNRELERVVARVRRETAVLIRRQLDEIAPRGLAGRVGVLRRRSAALLHTAWPWVLGAVVGCAMLFGIVGTMDKRLSREGRAEEALSVADTVPYADRSRSYLGPTVEAFGETGPSPDLVYSPENVEIAFAAFKVEGMDEHGRPAVAESQLRPDSPVRWTAGRPVDVRLRFRSDHSVLRVPVPTGHHVEAASVRVNGRPMLMKTTTVGEPLVILDGVSSGELVYRTRPAAVQIERRDRWPAVPQILEAGLNHDENQPAHRRILEAIELVRRHLEERRGPEFAARLALERARDLGLFQSAVNAGGGDCDVVNAVLAALLEDMGFSAVLAVGWLGSGGRPLPGLHAWVEVDIGDGEWIVADATRPGLGRSGTPRENRRAADEVSEPLVDLSGINERFGDLLRNPWMRLIAGVLLVIVAGVGAALVLQNRARRRFVVAEPGRGVDLVAGLIESREDWAEDEDLRTRALFPCVGGGLCSLVELENAHRDWRLLCASGKTALEGRSLGSGAVVIDTSCKTGEVAARSFAATDLDLWRKLEQESTVTRFSETVEKTLSGCGFVVKILESEAAAGPMIGFSSGARGDRLVVARRGSVAWQAASRQLAQAPQEAVLRGADSVLWALGSPKGKGRRVLTALARSVVEVEA